jgi:hypothetical protein
MKLTEKLQQLTADERSEMEGMVTRRGEAYVLAHWQLLLDQVHYINTF